VYYIKRNDSTGELWKVPITGGEGSKVLPSVISRCYSLVNEGIYFIPEPGPDRKFSVQFLRFATGKVRMVAMMSREPAEGLSVSPDSRFMLFSQFDQTNIDLMLVENFR